MLALNVEGMTSNDNYDDPTERKGNISSIGSALYCFE